MKKRLFKRRDKAAQTAPTRITNETVAEHRERILAGGRRFKYPVQYARHRLVFNTIIITVAALLLIILIGWWQLYLVQTTSTFFYRVVRVLPLPVASVDGQPVAYADYLMYYNGSAHYLQNSEAANLQSESAKRQLDDIKRKSIDTAIMDTYAAKRAHELGIEVTDAEIDQVVSDDRSTVNGRISQETYDASALSVLGWSPEEYRQDIKAKLLRQKVAYAIDEDARKRQEHAAQLVGAPNADFDKIALELGGEGDAKVTTGNYGMVPHTNKDGGLSAAAAKLEKGQISPVIKTTTGDGYYFLKVLDKTDTQVNYIFLRIPLTALNQTITTLKNDNKVQEFIRIQAAESQKST
jgi:hypothetical protein